MPTDWDARYRDNAEHDYTPASLLVQAAEYLAPGRALDLACGVGRHALHLAKLGWEVTAVDASAVAIDILRRRAAAEGLRIDARRADLERGEYPVPPDAWDLICDFFYLQRNLFPDIRAGVRLGGAFAGAIHLFEESASGVRPRNPAFLLRPGELREQFAGWKIVYYSEGPEAGHRRRAARIIARKA